MHLVLSIWHHWRELVFFHRLLKFNQVVLVTSEMGVYVYFHSNSRQIDTKGYSGQVQLEEFNFEKIYSTEIKWDKIVFRLKYIFENKSWVGARVQRRYLFILFYYSRYLNSSWSGGFHPMSLLWHLLKLFQIYFRQ